MSKRKTRDGRRQTAAARREPLRPGKPKATFWHNRKVWLAGAAGTVVTGVVTGVSVNVSNNVLTAHNIGAPPVLAPSGSARASSPADAPTSSTASNHRVRAARSASTGAARSANTGPPLTVVSEDPINLDDAGVWVFPGKVIFTPSELKILNTSPGAITEPFINLLFSLGGYQAYPDTQIVVQNNQAQTIRVLNMNVVKSCQAPLTGTLIYAPNGGADPSIKLGFNLDSTDTEAETAGEWTVQKPDYFAGHTVSIQPGAQEVFDIKTVTSKYSCSFRFLLTLLVGSKKTYQLIGDGSQPFRISAILSTKYKKTKFSAYDAIYAGGLGRPVNHLDFVRVNPKTYQGH